MIYRSSETTSGVSGGGKKDHNKKPLICLYHVVAVDDIKSAMKDHQMDSVQIANPLQPQHIIIGKVEYLEAV